MSAIDFDYLETFAAHDRQVVLEVLALFSQQAVIWADGLDAEKPGWRDVAHTIKGAARGIGANALGDACDRAEYGEASELAAVRAALDTALAEIRAYQAAG